MKVQYPELYALMRKYSVEKLQGTIAYSDGKYYSYFQVIKQFKPPLSDSDDAEQLIHKALIDYALDHMDEALFDALTREDDEDTDAI